jgi:hypothetical protein
MLTKPCVFAWNSDRGDSAVPDLLRQGAAWLQQQMSSHCASDVLYRRGAQEQTVRATFGRTKYEVDDGQSVRITAHVMDFLIAAEGFSFGEPRAGDQIVADGVTYEVLNLPGANEWRWSDPFRGTLRVHAKEIGHES